MFPPSMRSVFGVSSPAAPQSDLVGEYLGRVLPAIRQQKEWEMNQELANRIKMSNPSGAVPRPQPFVTDQGGTANKPMNVVAQGMTPYEQARIALMGKQEEGKTTRAEESIAGRKDIASQTEAGRQSRAQLRSTTSLKMNDDKLKQRMKEFGLKEDQFDLYKQIHNMSDSERLQAVQDGRISMEHLRHVNAMELADEKGDIGSRQIDERGAQQRKTKQSSKGDLTPQQQAQDYENRARSLLSQHPEYKGYIKFNQDTGKLQRIENGGDDNIFHSINQQIYGNNATPISDQDINLPTPKSSNESSAPGDDNSSGNVTQYQKGDDPLNLFGGNSNIQGDEA